MGVVTNSGTGFKYLSIKSKNKSGQLDPGLYDNLTGEKLGNGYSGKLLAMRPDAFEYKGKTKHKWVLIMDGGDDDNPELVKIELNFSGIAKSLVNTLSRSVDEMRALFQTGDITITAYPNGEHANISVKVNGERTNWMYEWDKIKAINDKPEKWIAMWEKHIKPYVPEEFKVNGNQSATADVGPSTEDDLEDDQLPF